MKLIKQTRFWVSIAIFVALFASAFVIKSFAWNAGAWDTSGSWGNYGYTPCPANSSCVFNNPILFPNPSTPTPTTYSYNGFSFSIPASAVSSNGAFFTWTASVGYNVPDLQIIGSEGVGGLIPYFLFETKDGVNGINNGVLRGFYLESYAGQTFIVPYNSTFIIGSDGYNHTMNKSIIISGAPTILASLYANPNLVDLYLNTPFTVTSNQYSYASTGIGITMATNAGQGIYTQTQNNAIMNTGPIYPRNPANVAQTLTQPTIQSVYDNNLAGISYTGWSVTGSGNLSSGVLTVNLGLPFDNVNAYRCSANYDGVPTTVAGFLAITKNSGSQFVITSVNSTGGTNTTDANKVQWTCIGY
jgi:hypothetical protein